MRKLIFRVVVAGCLLALGALLSREWAGGEAPVHADQEHPRGLRGYRPVVELLPPSGLSLDPSASIESRTDGTGSIFVAATTKSGEAVVWRQTPSGMTGWRSVRIDLGRRFEGGRGSLSVEEDSNLYLTVWGKNTRAYRVRVPGWAPGDTPK